MKLHPCEILKILNFVNDISDHCLVLIPILEYMFEKIFTHDWKLIADLIISLLGYACHRVIVPRNDVSRTLAIVYHCNLTKVTSFTEKLIRLFQGSVSIWNFNNTVTFDDYKHTLCILVKCYNMFFWRS